MNRPADGRKPPWLAPVVGALVAALGLAREALYEGWDLVALAAVGANTPLPVLLGEPDRLVMGSLVCGSRLRSFLDAGWVVALGGMLEAIVGAGRLCVIMVVGSVAALAASGFVPSALLGSGTSGITSACAAALLVLAFRGPRHRASRRVRIGLVVAIVAWFGVEWFLPVDSVVHAVSLALGAVFGLATPVDREAEPPFRVYARPARWVRPAALACVALVLAAMTTRGIRLARSGMDAGVQVLLQHVYGDTVPLRMAASLVLAASPHPRPEQLAAVLPAIAEYRGPVAERARAVLSVRTGDLDAAFRAGVESLEWTAEDDRSVPLAWLGAAGCADTRTGPAVTARIEARRGRPMARFEWAPGSAGGVAYVVATRQERVLGLWRLRIREDASPSAEIDVGGWMTLPRGAELRTILTRSEPAAYDEAFVWDYFAQPYEWKNVPAPLRSACAEAMARATVVPPGS